jgi:putative ABC transport system ATP-binding protein
MRGLRHKLSLALHRQLLLRLPEPDTGNMEPTIFRFVLRYSRSEQIKLLLMTLAAFPLLYFSLDLPKTIINEAINGDVFPREFLGQSFEQISYLATLCASFLLLVLVNGAFKYVVNVYRGVVGERMLRRLRFQLFERVLRFPPSQFRKLSQGEIVAMVISETEMVGGYIGDSIALPAFQGGTLITILIFMFIQDPVLGFAAIALYPLQGWLIPKFQRKLNLLKKERVFAVRKLSERIGEVVNSVGEIHAHDTSQFELSDYSQRVGEVFVIRLQIYKQKFFIKFLNNFIAQITPFFFYSIGGYLVIEDSLSFGALVAVLAAYKDLSSPWKELLNYYQVKEDARIKYGLLLETFAPPGLLDTRILSEDVDASPELKGAMVATNVDLSDSDGDAVFADGLNFNIDLPRSVAVLGPEGSGKHRLASVLGGLLRPRKGSVAIAGVDLAWAPQAITGRRIAYVGQQTLLRSETLRDNLYYGLKHRPIRAAEYSSEAEITRQGEMREALLSGNSTYDINADWIDYDSAGVDGPQELTQRAIDALQVVDMAKDIHDLGLQGRVNTHLRPELAAGVLAARNELHVRLNAPEFSQLVEAFDLEQYNTNMSVAENLLFGAPLDSRFEVDQLPHNEDVLAVLREFELETDFVEIGRQVANLMVELFADVEPGSPLFEQFSFISADDLPVFRSVLSRVEAKYSDEITAQDRQMLLTLPFKLVVSRHRLGLIDDAIRMRVVQARAALLTRFGGENGQIEAFDSRHINSAVSIQDNILFGRLAFGRARSGVQVGGLLREVIEKLGLRQALMEAGLDFHVGIGGSRLSAAQRQKLAIARAVLKRPDILLLDEATASLDESTQQIIMDNLLAEFSGRSVFWLLHREGFASRFSHVLVLADGKAALSSSFADIGGEEELKRHLASVAQS